MPVYMASHVPLAVMRPGCLLRGGCPAVSGVWFIGSLPVYVVYGGLGASQGRFHGFHRRPLVGVDRNMPWDVSYTPLDTASA